MKNEEVGCPKLLKGHPKANCAHPPLVTGPISFPMHVPLLSMPAWSSTHVCKGGSMAH